ncbi:MAG: glycoside hydrolase family 10 protein [Mucilaginibacter sp.]|uniref:glycoside hydrolase family 10 protein n=1 Tax=Mucilaginibacter sp. L3T2-6 TaxID=3062491 RepID=UPI002675D44C|nr:family 10 glycosylhydrolase [Mucilaginibacter sp. L3T2-6]MDO3641920.1 family 10 glycosylhydrolase [Mucilaginibacter sp. L3T2-6]MDV6214402.1 family 10 glycosylhydrolase [Mucilaginibacter sp. L3T2-6]
MRIKRLVILLISILIFCTHARAQLKPAIDSISDEKEAIADTLPPKREFRGVWIATVENIDWPSKPGLPTDQQKQEMIDRLNAHQRQGINEVMFQIRPAADAFYAKSREPWSKWLTGKQGQGPNPSYDPLEFAITEAHKRGMELHAWFNPYRATNDGRFSLLSPAHITRIKPEWFFTYGGIKLFNPGIPEVRDYIVKVFLDVVDNYDIDGVHMDDYFYPYPIDGQKINDAQTFAEYGQGYDDIKDWRRHNVDTLIQMLSDSIQAHNPRVKFGISPFGIWANKYQNPEGSATHGGSSNYELYADSRKWVKEGWVDYINPQLYWPLGDRSAAFDTLVNWWSDNTYGRHLYIGMAAYRINERKVNKFKNPAQMPDQIKYLRANPRVQGSVYFSSKSLINNPLGFADSLKENYYKYPALPPVMLWLDSIPPNAPQNFTATPMLHSVQLKWTTPLPAKDNETAYGYVVYRFEEKEKINLNDPKHILHIQYNNSTSFVDDSVPRGKTYMYVVTALDRLKNESDPSPTIAGTAK